MTNQNTTTTISNLTRNIQHVELNVRVVCLWDCKSYIEKGIVYKIEMILVDQEHNIIQATIVKPLLHKFRGKVIEGLTYKLGNIAISDNVRSTKASQNPLRIWFQASTYVVEIDALEIPKFGFQFTTFSDIIQKKVQATKYIDVIGKIKMLHPVVVSPTGNEWMQVDLIDNENNILPFFVFGDHAGQICRIMKDYDHLNEAPILRIKCAIQADFRGEVRIVLAKDATRIYVNPILEEGAMTKIKYFDESSSSSNQVNSYMQYNHVQPGKKICTIKEINKTVEPGVYKTVVTIVGLDTSFKWYYMSCKYCEGKASLGDDNFWKCSNANCSVSNRLMSIDNVIPRFQVRYYIADDEEYCAKIDNDEDHHAKIILLESQIEAHCCTTATKCLAKMKEKNHMKVIPQELTTLIGKKFVCTIEVMDMENMKGQPKTYMALNITDDEDTVLLRKEQYLQQRVKVGTTYQLAGN